jgi:hypothetical protein
MSRVLLFCASFILIFAACNKVDEVPSNEDMLIGGVWHRSSLKATHVDPSTGVATTTNLLSTLKTCVVDNTLEFDKNYVGTEYRNNKCIAGDVDQQSIRWGFTESGTKLRIYNAYETFYFAATDSIPYDVNAEVISFSDNYLAIRYLMIDRDPLKLTADTTTITDVFRR